VEPVVGVAEAVVEAVEEVPAEVGAPGTPGAVLVVDDVVVVAPVVEGAVVVGAVGAGLVTGMGAVDVLGGWLLVEVLEGGAEELVEVELGAVGEGTVVVLGP
jgi:hypothetical protein